MAASRTVTRTALLGVGADRAWAAVARPEHLGAWLGVDLALEVVPGALGTASDERGLRAVRVDAVEAPVHLAWTWWPLDDDDAPPSRVDLHLDPVEGGTRLTVTETALPDLPDTLAAVEARRGGASLAAAGR